MGNDTSDKHVIIVPKVTDHLMDRMGSKPILSVNVNLTRRRRTFKALFRVKVDESSECKSAVFE